eukprot:359139-Chlamydomonas_euryale.AAC.24
MVADAMGKRDGGRRRRKRLLGTESPAVFCPPRFRGCRRLVRRARHTRGQPTASSTGSQRWLQRAEASGRGARCWHERAGV